MQEACQDEAADMARLMHVAGRLGAGSGLPQGLLKGRIKGLGEGSLREPKGTH